MTRLASLIMPARVLGALVLLSWPTGATDAGSSFAISPVMSRGSATAPVTIVEFSDYQ